MRYISPASLFGEPVQYPIDKKAIQLGRKKLFAEMELTGGESLEIHGSVLSISDIIDYLEDLQKENVADYHRAIEEDAVLLCFLEESLIGQNDRFNDNPLYDDDQFLHWISPWFSSSFTTLANACFKLPDADSLNAILGNKLLMSGTDLEQSWISITKILTNNISHLNYYREENQKRGSKFPLERITHLLDFQYIQLLRLLPANRFGTLKDNYAFTVMQTCIHIFNKESGERSNAIIWLENVISIARRDELRDQLTDKLEEMRKISKRKRANMIFRIVWISIILIRVATCNDTSSPDFHNAPVYYVRPGDTTGNMSRHSIDSILRTGVHQYR